LDISLCLFLFFKFLLLLPHGVAVKVWDMHWDVKMVFVGHSGAVSDMATYPHGPLFLSAAEDCTIRVWSMETCDEVDKWVID
jgi:WD40 repeat protein